MSKQDQTLAQVLKIIDENQRKLAALLGSFFEQVRAQGKLSDAASQDLDKVEQHLVSEQLSQEIEAHKDVITHAYSKAQAYGKAIIFGFYGIFFGLHSIVGASLDERTLNFSIFLMVVSATGLALFEVGNSAWQNWSLFRWMSNQEQQWTRLELGDEVQKNQKNTMRSLSNIWIGVLFVSLTTAVGAVGIFVNTLVHSLV